MTHVTQQREAIIDALPVETSNSGQAPALKNLYVPPAHIKALRLDCHLVIGARGVGKSVWTAALSNPALRKALGSTIKELENIEVRVGFSEKTNIDAYPDSDTFSNLLEKYHNDSVLIWKSVVARWVAECLQFSLPVGSWADTIAWVKENPEKMARLMQDASLYFLNKRQNGLLVFDALDRSSQNWQTMDIIVRGLLQTVLWLKPFDNLSSKVFLREDQFTRSVTNFPDASKLQATRTELTWAAHDLHGLLWQTFINANEQCGELLRKVYNDEVKEALIQQAGAWFIPETVKRSVSIQRTLFEKLAGPWMGRDKRRGVPYLWAVNHLADGKDQTSPRSFLAAIRHAAEDSLQRYGDYPLALHYESIKRGIQKASEIRVNEISEDYSWVPNIMEPLEGLSVPIEYAQVHGVWTSKYQKGPLSIVQDSLDGLPPQHINNDWDGIKEDLIRIGIFTTRKDGRLDMPDLYRVGFGLGRRGGVKPNVQSP